MRKIGMLAALMFFALTGCEKDQGTAPDYGNQGLESRAQEKVFRAKGNATQTPVDGVPDCSVYVPYAYEADHWGNMKGTFIGNADLEVDGCWFPAPAPGVNLGVAVMYTSQGDLYFDYFTDLFNTGTDGVYYFSGTYLFTGGTDRFEGVSGTGTITGIQDTRYEGMPVEYNLEGTIVF